MLRQVKVHYIVVENRKLEMHVRTFCFHRCSIGSTCSGVSTVSSNGNVEEEDRVFPVDYGVLQ